MKILVTGAAGFIGSHLCEKLKELGHEVVGLDNFSDHYDVSLKEMNAKDLSAVGVEVLKLDLAEDDLSEVVKDVEVVYHMAAQPGISQKVPFEDYVRNNLIAAHRLMDALKESKTLKLFVNTATSSVYGKHATDTEDTVPKPASHYGVTKLAAEQLVLSYFRDFGFPACSLRPFSVYGPRERPEKLYPKLIAAAINNTEFPLREGSSEHLRSYTFVSDIIDGYVLVLDKLNDCLGEIFNIGIDTAITTGESIALTQKYLKDTLGREAKIKKVSPVPGDQKETRANISKIKRVLGYNPRVSPEDGLKRTVSWYVEKFVA